MSGPLVDAESPENRGVLAYLRRRAGEERPLVASPDSFTDPYLSLGSHPDVVERVWDALGSGTSPAGRCVVVGCPALVEPTSGIVVALALGTTYALRVATADYEDALAAGLEPTHAYFPPSSVLDARATFGPSWLFGAWAASEPEWVTTACAAVRR
jgi:hypothetical protein